MSRTKRGSKAPGHDFGARYQWNKGYCAGYGKVAKRIAASERRNESKRLVRQVD